MLSLQLHYVLRHFLYAQQVLFFGNIRAKER